MSRPKLTNTPEELKKLFRDYPRIVSAFRWIEHHQDCLTGSMRVEEYPREQLSYAKKAAQRKEKAVKAAAESHYSSDEDSAYSNSSTSSHNSGEAIRRSPASTNNGIADEDYEEIEYTTGPCEEHFISSGNSPKVLFAMAIGVGPDRETLISAEQEPFLSTASRKMTVTRDKVSCNCFKI